MALKRPDLVLFDLDGTLVDSAPDLAYSLNAMLSELSMAPHGEEQVREWIGSGAERLVKRALTGRQYAEPDESLFLKAFDIFSEIYIENTCRNSTLNPGVLDGLHYLMQSERIIGCITNKRHRFTEPLLKALGILDHFAIVISGDTLPRKKPDPLPLLHAMEQLGKGKEKTLMVGDSINDVEAARGAGTAVLCVRNGYNNGNAIEDCQPDLIIDTLVELPHHI